MLNNPGEDVAASPAEETKEHSGSHVVQLVVIGFVGLYLFGMVWLYAHLPWLALTVTAVAVLIMVFGFIRQITGKPAPD